MMTFTPFSFARTHIRRRSSLSSVRARMSLASSALVAPGEEDDRTSKSYDSGQPGNGTPWAYARWLRVRMICLDRLISDFASGSSAVC